jgi:hypothetical protein
MSITYHSIKLLAATALILSMAGCGHDPGERALSGAGIGAAGGAVGGALMGSPATGALLGGAAGAAAGGLTSDRDFDLGEPFWK